MSESDKPDEITDTTNREALGWKLAEVVKTQQLEGIRAKHFTDTKNICNTCKWATITRQASKNNQSIRCSYLERDVPGDIIECNEYKNITQLTLGQMSELAILIDNGKPRRVGFYHE